MATTKAEIRAWFIHGKKQGATHLVVCCDTFNYTDFPIYVGKGEDPLNTANLARTDMLRVMEVYALHLDMEAQLAEYRAFHYDAAPTTPPETPIFFDI